MGLKGDIEALADARRALKNFTMLFLIFEVLHIPTTTCTLGNFFRRLIETSQNKPYKIKNT